MTAGWHFFLKSGKQTLKEVGARTGDAFDLMRNVAAELQVPNLRLFLDDEWPARFRFKYREAIDACDPQAMARIGAEAIDSYIATNGWQTEQ